MIKELNHVGLLTGAIDRAIEFYTDILGGEIIRDARPVSGNGRFVYIQLGQGVIELIKVEADNPNRGLAHIAFLIDDTKDLDQDYAELTKMGYVFTVPPKAASSGDGRLAFFNDASRVSFELIQRKENIRRPDLKNPYIKAFDHISVHLEDSNYHTCVDFYTKVFGFKLKEKLENGGKTSMSYYSLGPDTLELILSEGSAAPEKPLWHISFCVDSCADIRKRLIERNIQCPEPRQSHFGSFNILHVQGRDGELIEFLDR